MNFRDLKLTSCYIGEKKIIRINFVPICFIILRKKILVVWYVAFQSFKELYANQYELTKQIK